LTARGLVELIRRPTCSPRRNACNCHQLSCHRCSGVWPLVGLQSERLNRAWLDFGPMPAVEPCHIVFSGGDEDGSSAQTKHCYHGSRASGADPDLFGLCRDGHQLGLCRSGIPPEVGARRCFVAMGAVMKGGKTWGDPETAAPSPQRRTRLLKRHAR